MMMRNNPSIRSAEEAVVQAGLDLKDSKANFSPTIELSGSMTYMTDPLIGPVIMESSDILSQMGLGSYADRHRRRALRLYPAYQPLLQPCERG